jgi:lactate permease
MILVIKVWRPRDVMRLEGDKAVTTAPPQHSAKEVFWAWSPYLLLVIFVLIWGDAAIKAAIDRMTTILIPVPGLHDAIIRVPPVMSQPAPYAAVFTFNWLSAAGTACFLAGVTTALVLGVRPSQFINSYGTTFRQLALPMLTIASMLALAYLMNYSGMTSTLGLAFAGTGWAFPFFAAMLGWIGVFLTGSDTSANALFGNLQVVTANTLGLNPILTASVNSAAGVMGKMISLQSIAVAVAATGMTTVDESRLFRFTLKYSILLATMMGILAMLFAYMVPAWVPVLPLSGVD